MKKEKLIAGSLVLIALLLVGINLNTRVFAEENSNNNVQSLIQKITDKFNLPKGEVDKLVNEHRSEIFASRQKQIEERLNRLVSEGKLTEEQKSKILVKHEEIFNQKTGFWDLTRDEKRAKMREIRIELQEWAEENGIELKYIFGFNHGMGFNGSGMGRMAVLEDVDIL